MDWKDNILSDAYSVVDGYIYRDLHAKALEYLDDVMQSILSDREQDILRERYMKGTAYTTLGIKYAVSAARIMDMRKKALRKIRQEIKIRILSNGARNQEEAIQYLRSLPYEEKIKKNFLILRLHQRTSNTLGNQGVKTIGDVASFYQTSVPDIQGLSVETINKVRKLLSDIGALDRPGSTDAPHTDGRVMLESTQMLPHCIDILHSKDLYTLKDVENYFRTQSDLTRMEGIGDKAASTILLELSKVGLEIPDYAAPCLNPALSSPESITLMNTILEQLPDKRQIQEQKNGEVSSDLFYKEDMRLFCQKKANIMAVINLLEQRGGIVSLGFYEREKGYQNTQTIWYLELV